MGEEPVIRHPASMAERWQMFEVAARVFLTGSAPMRNKLRGIAMAARYSLSRGCEACYYRRPTVTDVTEDEHG